MNQEEFLQKISSEETDLNAFVLLALEDVSLRNEMINQMIHHPHIMVYFHCYEVAARASELCPELFYPYWDEIVPLLNHKNSYHRDMALTLLANLAGVDAQNRMAAVIDPYLAHLHDVKFGTAVYCVRNTLKILQAKPELRERVIQTLLEADPVWVYPEKQKALIRCDVLDILDTFYAEIYHRPEIQEYIRQQCSSISPKTKKKAKEMCKKHEIEK